MAEFAGAELTIAVSPDGVAPYVVEATVQSKSVAINNEPIDITNDDSDAWRTLLDRPSLRSIDLSVSGVYSNDGLIAESMAATSSITHLFMQVTFGTEFTLTGKFALTSVSSSGEYTDAVKFEASLQSSGEVVKAAV